jgi:putative methionine-R-sulfoxide reductase with GAF domain
MSEILQKLFRPLLSGNDEIDRTARMLNLILVVLFVVGLLAPLPIYLIGRSQGVNAATSAEQLTMVVVGLVFAAASLGIRSLMYRGQLRLASWLVSGLLWLFVTFALFQFRGIHNPTVFAYSLVIAVPTVLLRERKAIILFTGLTLAALTAVYLAEASGQLIYIPQPIGMGDLIVVGGTFLLLGIILVFTIQDLDRAVARAMVGEVTAAKANEQLQTLNDQLESRVAARTQALVISAAIGRDVSTILDKEQLVKDVADKIRNAFNYYQVHLYLLNEAGDTLELAAGSGYAGAELVARQHTVPIDKGLVGRAARTNEPVIAPDVNQVESWLPNPSLPDTKSEVTVPISLGNKVLGVLDIQQNIRNSLGQNEADLLISISGQVAVALQNANLLAQAQQRADYEGRLNEVNQQIQSATTLEQAMQIAVREVGRALNAPQARVRLGTRPLPQNGHTLQESVIQESVAQQSDIQESEA